jgi:hypothetical protein
LIGHEPHRGPLDRLADRFGVVAVVLALATIWSDELSGHDPHRVAEGLETTCPLVRAATGFQPNYAGLKVRNKLEQPVAAHRLAQRDASRLVDAMHAEHVLCEVDAHRSNLGHDFPS